MKACVYLTLQGSCERAWFQVALTLTGGNDLSVRLPWCEVTSLPVQLTWADWLLKRKCVAVIPNTALAQLADGCSCRTDERHLTRTSHEETSLGDAKALGDKDEQ